MTEPRLTTNVDRVKTYNEYKDTYWSFKHGLANSSTSTENIQQCFYNHTAKHCKTISLNMFSCGEKTSIWIDVMNKE